MYDELVKRLRESVGNRDEKCDCCPYEEDYPCCVDCLDKMHREAANAIEELRQIASHYEEESKGWWLAACDFKEERERLREAMPRWIPVTEPPKEDGKYITLFADGFVCENHYMVFTKDDMHPEGGKWYHNEASLGGVTHWMPIPTPPKEEI